MVTIIIGYVRPHLMPPLLTLIKQNAHFPYRVLVKEDVDRIGHPAMVNKLFHRAKTNLVCMLADDALPQPGFLKEAVSSMAELSGKWGVVGMNDLTGRPGLPCHWLAHRKVLPLLDGDIFHPGYNHLCVDNELGERTQQAGRYIFSEKSIVVHNHPLLKGVEIKDLTDKDYLKAYSDIPRAKDQLLLKTRRDHGWETPISI